MEEATFADWTLPIFSRGMLRGEALSRYVNTHVGNKLIGADGRAAEALWPLTSTAGWVCCSSAVTPAPQCGLQVRFPRLFLPVKIGCAGDVVESMGVLFRRCQCGSRSGWAPSS